MSSFIGPRIAAFCGVAFAILFMLSVMAINVPHGGTDQEFIDWYADGGNRSASIISGYLMFGTAVTFIMLFSYLRDRLDQDGTGAGNPVFAISLGAFGMLLAVAAMRGAIASAVTLSDEPLPGVDTLRYIPQIGSGFITFALLAMGVNLVVLFLAIRKTAALPAWFGVASSIFGLATIAGAVLAGPFAIPIVVLWAIVAAIAVFRSAPATATASLQQATASS